MGIRYPKEEGPERQFLRVSCLPKDYANWQKAAHDRGTQLANWVRDTLNAQYEKTKPTKSNSDT